MESKVNKYRYLLTLFMYSLRDYKPRMNTMFRLIYIYEVSTDYLTGEKQKENETIFVDQRHQGVGDYNLLFEAFGQAKASGYILESEDNTLCPGEALQEFINNLQKRSDDAKNDIHRISYFADVVASYGEDVILAIFFKEPNYEDALNRKKSEIDLTNNILLSQLNEYERIAGKDNTIKLKKYDVFISWLNFILDEYIKGKN